MLASQILWINMIQFYKHLPTFQIFDMKNEYVNTSCGWQKQQFEHSEKILELCK